MISYNCYKCSHIKSHTRNEAIANEYKIILVYFPPLSLALYLH